MQGEAGAAQFLTRTTHTPTFTFTNQLEEGQTFNQSTPLLPPPQPPGRDIRRDNEIIILTKIAYPGITGGQSISIL